MEKESPEVADGPYAATICSVEKEVGLIQPDNVRGDEPSGRATGAATRILSVLVPNCRPFPYFPAGALVVPAINPSFPCPERYSTFPRDPQCMALPARMLM